MKETKKNSLLIVDDEKSNLKILTHILSPEYTVYTAKDGVDAIKKAKEYLPDVILLDIIMPEMDGWETYNKIRGIDALQTVPIVFVTALNGEFEKKHAHDIGAADFITKPYKKDDLIHRIGQIIN